MGTRKMDRGVRTLFALVTLLALNLLAAGNERAEVALLNHKDASVRVSNEKYSTRFHA